jgi:serine/threonine protein kinase
VTDHTEFGSMSSPGTRIGTEVAGYRIESVIGRGGMSVIYLATQVRLQRRVALKLLATELSQDERFRERFIQESRLASEINHPNIIPIFDAGEDSGYLYIAMRYVDGPSLRELLRRDGPLGLGRLIYIVEQVSSALDVAHAAGLVHRDIKPGNILVEEAADHAFLTDFGVAKRTTARGLTQTGLIVGTFEYVAPEQIEALPVDARTDVYGLGCTVYECLTGRLPFEHESEVAVINAHLKTPPPNVSQTRPDLPMALNDFVAKAMAKAPDDRYQSCGELAAALRAAALRSSTGPRPVVAAPLTHPGEPADRPNLAATVVSSDIQAPASASVDQPQTANQDTRSARRRPWMPVLVAGAIVAAAALGAGAFALVHDNGSGAAAGTEMGKTTPMTTSDMGMGTVDTNMPVTQRLTTFVGKQPWTCESMSPMLGPVATQMCGTHVPQQLYVSVFSSKAKLYSAYAKARDELGSPKTGSGDCGRSTWAGEGEWLHGEGEPGGRKFCLLKAAPLSRIVWYSDLGTPTLYRADYKNLDHRTLYFWWVNFRHELF